MNDNIKENQKWNGFAKKMIEETIALLNNKGSINLGNKDETFERVIEQIQGFMQNEEVKSNKKATEELTILLEMLNKDKMQNEQNQNGEGLFEQVYENYMKKQLTSKMERKEQEYDKEQHKQISELQERANKFNTMLRQFRSTITVDETKRKETKKEDKKSSKATLNVIGMYNGKLGNEPPKRNNDTQDGPEI